MERKFYLNWQGIVAEAKYRRKQQGITQKHLALLAQVSTPTISRFESGSEDIELSSALRILHVLGLSDKRKLIFPDKTEKYNIDRKIIIFNGKDNDQQVSCAITKEALEDHYQGDSMLQKFKKNRNDIEHIARRKYLYNEREQDGSVLIRSEDLL